MMVIQLVGKPHCELVGGRSGDVLTERKKTTTISVKYFGSLPSSVTLFFTIKY